MSDDQFQAAYCRWAKNVLGIDDAVAVEFVHEEAMAWSDVTFEDASCVALVTQAGGETTRHHVEFDNDLIRQLLAAQKELAA